MAVSPEYLSKARGAVRVGDNYQTAEELTDLIEECRADLIGLGVLSSKANDETDSLIWGAVRCFLRWKFGISNPEADRMREDYMMMRDELRRRGEYCTSPTE